MRVRNQFYRLMEAAGDNKDLNGDTASGDQSGADQAKAGEGDAGGKQDAAAGAASAAADAGKPSNGDDSKAGYWPNDWRNRVAGTDEKLLKRLERYQSPDDVTKALIGLQTKISAGELRSPLPKNATEEQVKTWREENGIPESHDKYDLQLDKGLVIGDDDKPVIDSILKAVHEKHGNNEMASNMARVYFKLKEEAEVQQQEEDRANAQAAEDALRTEWGAEFRPNLNAIDNLFAMAPADLKDAIKFGRLADGTPIMANAGAIKWLNQLAREINPASTLIPNAGTNLSGAIDDEIKQIEKDMGAPKGTPEYKAYWEDDKRQARYRDLLDAREKSQKRA